MEGAGPADDSQEDFDEYYTSLQLKHDTEMEYYTEAAVRETQRWIEEVTKRRFGYPDDAIRSLEDGILLCELLNSIKPGSVKRINRLVSSKMAKMDNITVFLDTCRKRFGLRVEQLFDVSDLAASPDAASATSQSHDSNSFGTKRDQDRRLRNVAVTVFWLARQLSSTRGVKFDGPDLDFAAFAPLVAAKAGGPQPDDWSAADFDEQADYDSDMSSSLSTRDRSALGASLPDDKRRWRSSAGERFPSMDSLDDYGSGSGRASAGAGPAAAGGAAGEHRRMQSTDSLDSGCGERSGSSMARKGSSSNLLNDPLQFVQLKPAVSLARSAEETLRRAEAAKALRQDIDKGEEEWQGNLSSWKQKRKSQSSTNLFSSVDPAELAGSAPQSRGSSSNYHRYPYDDQPVDDLPIDDQHVDDQHADELDDSAFHSVVPSLDATAADDPALARCTKSDSDFGSCSPKDDGNNDADSESEGGCSEDGNYGQQYAQTVPLPGDSTSRWTASSRTAALAKTDSQASGKMRIVLKPPATIDDGFGFSIKGGVDKCLPITVETVVKGSPADEAGLAETDEVLEIGNEVVSNRSRGYCMLIINNALKKQARLDLVVQRDALKVAQAAADKKRSSLQPPKSIFDVYESAATDRQQSATVGNRPSSSDEVVKVTAALVSSETAVQTSTASKEYRSLTAASSANETLLPGASNGKQQSEMQAGIETGAVYTSFVQLRLSSGSADPDSQTVDASAADLSPGGQNRAQRRSLQAEEEDRKRMAEWAHEQELRQQKQYDSEQRALREQFEKDNAKAEELAILSRQQEREAARDRATKKLLELKSRFSSEAADGGSGGHVNGTDRPVGKTTRDRSADVSGTARANESTRHAQQRAPASGVDGGGSSSGSSISSKEEELRRKEQELRQMEERLLQERQRILQEKQSLLQMREQQQQLNDQRLTPQQSMAYSSSPPPPPSEQRQSAAAETSARPPPRAGAAAPPAPAATITTPPMSDVYKHFETAQPPEQLGSRDLTPPRLTRKEVMDMSRQAAAATDGRLASGGKQQQLATAAGSSSSAKAPQGAGSRPPQQQQQQRLQQQQQQQRPPQQQQVLSVKGRGSPGKQPPTQQQNRNSWGQSGRAATVAYDSAPQKVATVSQAEQQRRLARDDVDPPRVKAKAATLDRPSSQSKQKTVDLDPSMPTVVSKEDVLRLTREKPRYMRKAEQQQHKDQSDDSGSVHPLRKCISGYDMRRSDLTDNYHSGNRLTEAGSDEALNKSLDFRTSRAIFEQQSRDADAYWKQRQQQQDEQRRLQPTIARPTVVKSRTLDRPPSKADTRRSNGAPARPASGLVSSWIASSNVGTTSAAPAQSERRKELESVRQARQQMAAADDDVAESDDVGGAREKERRLREERNRELAAIRQLSRSGGSSTPDSEVAGGSSDREEAHWRRGEAQMSFESDQSSSKNSLPDFWQPPTPQHLQPPRPPVVDSEERQQVQQTRQTRPEVAAPTAVSRQGKLPFEGSKQRSLADEGEQSPSHARPPSASSRQALAVADPGRQTASVNGRMPVASSHDQRAPSVGSYYNDQPPPSQHNDADEDADLELPQDEDEGVLSVSAKQLCAYCSQELGRGAAMVIESLNVCYHVDCFRCWACRQLLSDGARGADVRVRDNRLHCKECYDNNNVNNGQLGEDDTFL